MSSLIEFISYNANSHITTENAEYLFNKRQGNVLCKCGKYRTVMKSKPNSRFPLQIGRTCGNSQCNGNYGAKRPAHAELMATRAKNGYEGGFFKPGRTNNYINSTDWKRTVFANKGISTAEMTDDQIEQAYCVFKSATRKTTSSVVNKIRTLVKMYSSQILKLVGEVPEITTSSPPDDIEKWKRLTNGLQTMNNVHQSGAKKFKRMKMSGFTHKIGKQSITTRSSYETAYVVLFEREGISWDYEPEIVYKNDIMYIPDFVFTYKDKTYVLEVKGFLTPSKQDEYFTTKMQVAREWCSEKGYEMLFSFNGYPTSIEEIITEKIENVSYYKIEK